MDKIIAVTKTSLLLAASGIKIPMAIELASEKQGVILTPQERKTVVDIVTRTVYRLSSN